MNNPKNSQNNLYQNQFPQQTMPAYPYNYLSNDPNQQAYQQAQYWNYYQYQQQNQQQNPNFYQQYNHYQQNNIQFQQQNYQTNNQQNRNLYNRNQNNNFHKNNYHQANNKNANNNNNKNNNNNRNYENKKSKQKINKRDLPENNKFYCEVCDRGFKTDEKYQEHCSTHTTCGVNGCKFTAAAKLVEIHYRNLHASGLDKKISNLQTDEEIQKYINERKRNFPTKSNLEKKTDLDQEKADRGAVLQTKQFGKFKNKRNYLLNHNNKNEKDTHNSENQQLIDDKTVNNESFKLERIGNKNLIKKRKNKKKSSLFSRKVEVLKNRYKKPTLLQKLLADEIRHERNILLQCVRYVVENNFFNK